LLSSTGIAAAEAKVEHRRKRIRGRVPRVPIEMRAYLIKPNMDFEIPDRINAVYRFSGQEDCIIRRRITSFIIYSV